MSNFSTPDSKNKAISKLFLERRASFKMVENEDEEGQQA